MKVLARYTESPRIPASLLRLRQRCEQDLWHLKSTGQFLEAQRQFAEFTQKGVPMTRKIISTMMYVYNQQGQYDQALKLWPKLEELNMRPNAASFTIYLSALAALKKLDEAENCLELFSKYSLATIELCNQLLDIFVKNQEYHRANKVVKFIVDSGLKLDLASYSIMFEMSLSMKSVEAINFFLERMGDDGIFPDTPLCNRLMEAFVELGHVERAKEIWDQMAQAGIKPDRNSYHIFLQMCGSNTDKLEETFFHIEKLGVVNRETCRIMFHIYYKLGDWKKAYIFFKRRLKSDFDDKTGTMMVQVYRKLDMLEEADELERILKTRYQLLMSKTKQNFAQKITAHSKE